MSKVNRRQEIKEKEELRAKFQMSMINNNSKVLGWLQPKKDTDNQVTASSSFLDLPIVPSGSGLSSINESSSKIGDFIRTEPSKLVKPERKSEVVGSKPLQALVNRMRDSSRSKINQRDQSSINKPKYSRPSIENSMKNVAKAPPKPTVKRPITTQGGDSDSDDEYASMVKSRTVKKSSVPFKGKGRPF